MIGHNDIVVPYRRAASDTKTIIVKTDSAKLGFFIFMSTALVIYGFSPRCNGVIQETDHEPTSIVEDER